MFSIWIHNCWQISFSKTCHWQMLMVGTTSIGTTLPLMRWITAGNLQGAIQQCHQALVCLGHSLLQVPPPQTVPLTLPVTSLRWNTKPIQQNGLAASLGYTHSFLELESSGQLFQLDIMPNKFGTNVGAKRVSSRSVDSTHAEASSAQLRPGITVSQVIEQLRKHENSDYDLIHKNCHSFVQETLHWAAPLAAATESPNMKWENAAKLVDTASPWAVQMLLQAVGASRLGCCVGWRCGMTSNSTDPGRRRRTVHTQEQDEEALRQWGNTTPQPMT